MFAYKFRNVPDNFIKKWQLAKNKHLNRDELQIRELGLDPRSTKVSKYPHHEYDYTNDSKNYEAHNQLHDVQYYEPNKNYLQNSPEEILETTEHTIPEDFGNLGERHEQDQHAQEVLKELKPEVDNILLNKFQDITDDLGHGHEILQTLRNKMRTNSLENLDWHVLADYLEENGINGSIFRKYANKIYN